MSPPLSRTLAFLGPLLLSSATVAAYVAPQAPNPRPALTERAEQKLWRGAEVLVVGNSTAWAAIIDRPLGNRLGKRSAHVTLLDSTCASWYAALRYRVFGTGERPEMVILAGPEFAFTALAPSGTHDLEYVLDLAGSEDPEVLARLAGPSWPEVWWFRARAHRETWQRAAFVGASRGVATWLGVRENARARDLFVDLNGAGTVGFDDAGADRPIENTFLPPIVELTRAHGSQLVVVRTPIRYEVGVPFVSSPRNDKLRTYLTEHGVPYFDTIGMDGLLPKHFVDPFHLHNNASVGFTRELSDKLLEWQEQQRQRRTRRR